MSLKSIIQRGGHFLKNDNNSLSLELKKEYQKKINREKMQIILQNGFLMFVRRYSNIETDIFNVIHNYFFDTLEYEYREEIKNKQKEGIFFSSRNMARLSARLLEPSEKTMLVEEVIKKEKIITCVKLFRQMLLENEIPLYLQYYTPNSTTKTISSGDIFLIEDAFYELLFYNFERIKGAYVKYIESDLIDCMNIFFKEFNKEDPDYSLYRKDEDINAFFKLYIEKEINTIVATFQNDEDWKMRPEEDCAVSLYLQRTLFLAPTKVNKFLMPGAINTRKELQKRDTVNNN